MSTSSHAAPTYSSLAVKRSSPFVNELQSLAQELLLSLHFNLKGTKNCANHTNTTRLFVFGPVESP